MIPIDIQVHGYWKGHQLLGSSIDLSKEDQATIDRLSDVSGPLRPKEQFSPYLSTYPLPSGDYYVVARTWQDLSVSRAGCVRTKSLIIDSRVWSSEPHLVNILELLESSELPTEQEAVFTELIVEDVKVSPINSTFNVSEIVEALFLEESKPIVVFDAPEPELVALHLLTAIWPSMRKRFALSTFALAPRKIGGRDFDLVFAPTNAKAKFADWPGRRIDGRGKQIERHRWTGTIIHRLFGESQPKLLLDQDIRLLGNVDSDSGMCLRIALLWHELFEKLGKTPTAALGLLDIAKSGMVNHEEALSVLDSPLIQAIRNSKDNLPPIDAWEFIAAITRKIETFEMPASKIAVGHIVKHLSTQYPIGVIQFIQHFDKDELLRHFLPVIAEGLGEAALRDVEPVLLSLSSDIFAYLMIESTSLVGLVIEDERLIEKIATTLGDINKDLADSLGTKLLPFICEDRHIPIANCIFGALDSQDVVAQLSRISEVNAFHAIGLSKLLIVRAREVDELNATREILVESALSDRTKDLLAMTFKPVLTDILWIVNETRLPYEFLNSQFVKILRVADDSQLLNLLSSSAVCERLLTCIDDNVDDILIRATLKEIFPVNTQISVFQFLLPKLNNDQKFDIAERVLRRCLRSRIDGDETAVFSMLLDVFGAELEGRWIVREGMHRSIEVETISRNLVVFDKSSFASRECIVKAAGEIARALQERSSMDLSEEAFDACARLLLDAQKTLTNKEMIYIAGKLVPKLLRTRQQPVSSLIAAVFPIVYRELAKSNDAPELMKVFFFFDWDRCKAARNELVDAFMWSSWKAGDLALTACRCDDVYKMLKQVSKSHDGQKYLSLIDNDLMRLNDEDRAMVKQIIAEIIDDKASKKSW